MSRRYPTIVSQGAWTKSPELLEIFNASFHHAPMPKRQDTNAERNAMLVMTYFHPYTLYEDIDLKGVPHVRNLLAEGSDWTTAMHTWLQGRVLCREVQRYIQNLGFVSISQQS